MLSGLFWCPPFSFFQAFLRDSFIVRLRASASWEVEKSESSSFLSAGSLWYLLSCVLWESFFIRSQLPGEMKHCAGSLEGSLSGCLSPYGIQDTVETGWRSLERTRTRHRKCIRIRQTRFWPVSSRQREGLLFCYGRILFWQRGGWLPGLDTCGSVF